MKYEFFEFFEYFPIFHHFQYFFAVENEEVSIFVFLFDVLKFRVLYSRLNEWAGWGGGVLGRWEACAGRVRSVFWACVGRAWGQ